MQERPHSSQDWGIQPPPLTSAMFVWSVQPSRALSRLGQWRKWQRRVQIQIQKAAGLRTSEYHLGKAHKFNKTPQWNFSVPSFTNAHQTFYCLLQKFVNIFFNKVTRLIFIKREVFYCTLCMWNKTNKSKAVKK